VARAFAHAWAQAGPALPVDDLPGHGAFPVAGTVDLRVVASMPATASLYRLDQLIAALARKTLWLTDAYFVGAASYVQALRNAAADGMDVRLLVPGSSGDIKILRPITRAGYRPLLEAGVRVFEWNGSMLHAKTAVTDGRWARVGSNNLNAASWLGNWELDVAVEDGGFASEVEQMYLQDLNSATEIVLTERNRIHPETMPGRTSSAGRQAASGAGGSAGRLTAGAIRVGNTVEAALTNRRALGSAVAKTIVAGGVVLLTVAASALLWPLLLAVPVALLAAWIGVAPLIKACHLHRAAPTGTASDRLGSNTAEG
jgi:cardiolipin synthase A/B